MVKKSSDKTNLDPDIDTSWNSGAKKFSPDDYADDKVAIQSFSEALTKENTPAREKQIVDAIRSQNLTGRSTREKLTHEIRQMNLMILENTNIIIGKEISFDLRPEGAINNIALARERKNELLKLDQILFDEFGEENINEKHLENYHE